MRVHNSAEGNAANGSPYRIVLVVVSDKASAGTRADECVPAMRSALPPRCEVIEERIIPDDATALELLLRDVCRHHGPDGILTSGGTGLGPRDITPQTTLAVGDYEVPGLGEAMRAQSAKDVPTALLSRAVAVVKGTTLIVNLPGSPKAANETLRIIAPILPHAFDLLRGAVGEHAAH